VDAVPVLDLGLGAAGHRAFGEMHDCRTPGSGPAHELPDLAAVLAGVGRDSTLGHGDRDGALAHGDGGWWRYRVAFDAAVISGRTPTRGRRGPSRRRRPPWWCANA